jgi:hypothetical protein
MKLIHSIQQKNLELKFENSLLIANPTKSEMTLTFFSVNSSKITILPTRLRNSLGTQKIKKIVSIHVF